MKAPESLYFSEPKSSSIWSAQLDNCQNQTKLVNCNAKLVYILKFTVPVITDGHIRTVSRLAGEADAGSGL